MSRILRAETRTVSRKVTRIKMSVKVIRVIVYHFGTLSFA